MLFFQINIKIATTDSSRPLQNLRSCIGSAFRLDSHGYRSTLAHFLSMLRSDQFRRWFDAATTILTPEEHKAFREYQKAVELEKKTPYSAHQKSFATPGCIESERKD